MGPAALPPAPPAMIRTLEEFARQELGRGAEDPITLGDVQDLFAAIAKAEHLSPSEPAGRYRTPFRFGPKTKGRRDASLRSRSNRRK